MLANERIALANEPIALRSEQAALAYELIALVHERIMPRFELIALCEVDPVLSDGLGSLA